MENIILIITTLFQSLLLLVLSFNLKMNKFEKFIKEMGLKFQSLLLLVLSFNFIRSKGQ